MMTFTFTYPNFDPEDDDVGHYICPGCGEAYWENLSATPFCPSCGAGFYGDVLYDEDKEQE